MNSFMSFMSKYKAYFISMVLTIVVCFTAYFVVHWEIGRAKARAFEKAREVVEAPEKIDKASKIAGRAVFGIKNFKNKISEEVKRLEDSTTKTQ